MFGLARDLHAQKIAPFATSVSELIVDADGREAPVTSAVGFPIFLQLEEMLAVML